MAQNKVNYLCAVPKMATESEHESFQINCQMLSFSAFLPVMFWLEGNC